MKARTGILIALTILATGLIGCGHMPTSNGMVIALFSQVENYHITHEYASNAVSISVPAQAAKAGMAAAAGAASGLGFGNGAQVIGVGTTVFGYQGAKAPTNTPSVDVTP